MENYTKNPSKAGMISISDSVLSTDFKTQFQYGIEDNKVFLKISQILTVANLFYDFSGLGFVYRVTGS